MYDNRDRQRKKGEKEFRIDETHCRQIYGFKISQTRLIQKARNQILQVHWGQNGEVGLLILPQLANHPVFY